MKLTNEPIVFIGSGPVAAASLALLAENFIIEAVITKPRPAHHRGSVPVIETAQALGLTIIETAGKKAVTDAVLNTDFSSRVAVLIDFGIIIEQAVIDRFPLGIINSHFSLLPQWRGADPITCSILSGQAKTGVSLMLLVEAMDEGPLLAVSEYDMTPDIDSFKLTSDLIHLSHALLKDALPKYVDGKLRSASQEVVAATVGYSDKATYSRKFSKEDGILNWNRPATQLDAEIRAYAEWPKSRTILGGHAVVITKAHVVDGKGEPGSVLRLAKNLGVYTGQGILMIDKLKPAGKAEMSAADFLNGYGKDI